MRKKEEDREISLHVFSIKTLPTEALKRGLM